MQIRPRTLSSTSFLLHQPTVQSCNGSLSWHGMPGTCFCKIGSLLTANLK